MHSFRSQSHDSSEDSQPLSLADFIQLHRPQFQYPPFPPQEPLQQRLTQSVNNLLETTSQSDNSSNKSVTTFNKSKRKKGKAHNKKKAPPLGIFWDIENCQVPKRKSAAAIVQKLRDCFLANYREAEFLVVCDVKKESPQVVQELHDSQVNLIHVLSTSKNAADEKLRQSLRRFAEIYKPPSCIVLISSDINFAADLSDLRYRKKIRVILVHNANVADALILCANEHHYFGAITECVPQKQLKLLQGEFYWIVEVSNLPRHIAANTLKNRLSYLTSNCGGRVTDVVQDLGIATIRFTNQDFANRAQKRIQGEDVFGNKIKVETHSNSFRNYAGRRIRGGDNLSAGYSSRNNDLLCQDYASFRGTSPLNDFSHASSSAAGSRRPRGVLQDFQCLASNNRVHCTSGSSDFSDDGKSDCGSLSGDVQQQSVDLIISNLDVNFSIKELKRMLSNMLKEYAVISNINIVVQTDGSLLANIKVNSHLAAQCVISQLHRQKLGHKRIVIAYAQNNSPNLGQLREMVINVLQEAPDNQMPLFKCLELLESRFHCTVSVSDVHKLKDVCKINDTKGSRIISFASSFKTSPTSNVGKTLLPYCQIHCADGLPSLGWCELTSTQLPNVMIPLNIFAAKLNHLLDFHLGCMSLLSFPVCYKQECQEELPVEANGVPLEHLISCVANVEIRTSDPNKNIKVVKRVEAIDQFLASQSVASGSGEDTGVADHPLKNVLPSLASNINLLCRELVDLLKTMDKCQLSLNKFIPAYHHRFGRQCHLSDYGYTKLIDLFESISHVVQIMGEGSRKILTLSHQAQMRRFTSDLLRVLKVQPNKQITMGEYASAYEKIMNRQFNPVDYGLCTFEDLLCEVPKNIILISQSEDDGEIYIAIPKHEQTAKEIMRTKQFANEVIDILRYSPNYTMLFNKFVPAYHHHFGHQVRLADYGFAKLIELFEAIPDVVRIQEFSDGDRAITLTEQQALKLLCSQIIQLIKNQSAPLSINEIPKMYLKECGYQLNPQIYGCDSYMELIEKLSTNQMLKINRNTGTIIGIFSDFQSLLKIRTWALLYKPPHCKEWNTFQYEFQFRYKNDISLDNLNQLRNMISLSSTNNANYIALTDLFVLSAQLYHILYMNGGSVQFNHLDQLYLQCFGKNLKLSEFHLSSLKDLYEKFDFLFFICGHAGNVLALNRNLADYKIPLPSQLFEKKWSATPPPQSQLSAAAAALPQVSAAATTPTIMPPNKIAKPKSLSELGFSIELPIIENPKLMGNPFDLISPAKQLFPLDRNPWDKAPNANELPMPDKLMGEKKSGGVKKSFFHDDSNDSGVISKLEHSPPSDNENDGNEPCGLSAPWRLTTNFLNFDN